MTVIPPVGWLLTRRGSTRSIGTLLPWVNKVGKCYITSQFWFASLFPFFPSLVGDSTRFGYCCRVSDECLSASYAMHTFLARGKAVGECGTQKDPRIQQTPKG